MNKSRKDSTWVEPVLREGLPRVSAPSELWDRVSLPTPETPPSQPARTFVWMLAAASIAASVVAVAWGYYPHARADFRPMHTAELREWIRNRTGVDLPIASMPETKIQIVGVSLEPSGSVEVRYRVADKDAVLSIKPATNGRPHAELREIERATTVSWFAAEHAFTLTVHRAGDMQSACLICHADTTI